MKRKKRKNNEMNNKWKKRKQFFHFKKRIKEIQKKIKI